LTFDATVDKNWVVGLFLVWTEKLNLFKNLTFDATVDKNWVVGLFLVCTTINQTSKTRNAFLLFLTGNICRLFYEENGRQRE
jgi:hypothetical protein